MSHEVSVPIGAHDMSFEIGKLARMAAGSCLIRYGDAVVLAGLSHGTPRAGLNFLPLTMDYREKMYAGGRVPGGFFKREGRPSEKEVLTMRMMDRPMRPLFPDGVGRDIQVQAWVLSSDCEIDCDVLAINAGSCAVVTSDLAFNGPVGAVRMGRVDGQWIVNPTNTERTESDLDLVVVGTVKAITMVEGSAKEVPEAEMVTALELAHVEVIKICEAQLQLAKEGGKPKRAFDAPVVDSDLIAGIRKDSTKSLEEAHRRDGTKLERKAHLKAAVNEVVEKLVPEDANGERDKERVSFVYRHVVDVSMEIFRRICLSGNRYDGRSPTDVRDLACEVSFLPRTHGSALFQRGETQMMSTVTLGTKREEQLIEGLHETYYRKFMLHYNFPNFCVGDTRPIRGTSRREVGHGKLGERAIQAVLPDHESFPYTIRIVSETFESNGSSSMGSVCAGTLALMDAGVPISQPVAGIAMGLIMGTDGNEVIMTDIAGNEDSWGDMDFKVAGTQRGITALQMDIKIDGVSSELMQRALDQAKDARVHILKSMLTALRRPREELNPFAPRLEKIMIDKEKIGAVIGPGGKVIRGLQEQFEVTINVEDDGGVTIYSAIGANIEAAKETILAMTKEIQIGDVFEGKVISIKEFGAFLEIGPGREALCHVSELDDGYVERPEDVVNMGDVIKVRCINVDPSGKVKVSRKAIIREEKGLPPAESSGFGGRGGGRDRGPRRDGGGRGRGGDRGGRGGDRGGRGGPPRGGDRGGSGGGDRRPRRSSSRD